MFTNVVRLCVISITLFLVNFTIVRAEDKWHPYIDFEFKPGNDRTIGQTDFVIPIMQDDTALLTFNVRAMTANDVNGEVSIGTGYREIIDNSYILGGYGFFDRRFTKAGNQLNQATFGAEVLSDTWDARVNGYIPIGRDEKATGFTATPQISGTTLQLNTSKQTEKSLAGVDFELGYKIPILDDTRAYVGGYHFDASDVDNVTGSRARVEMRIHDLPQLGTGSRLTLGTEVQHDSVRDTQGFAIARVRIPFGEAKHAKRNKLERRMLDPIVRDVDIVSGSRSINTGTEGAAVSINGQNVAVDNIVFVDAVGLVGNAGTKNSPTTLANPITTTANTLVVIDGAGGAITNEDFTLGANTVVIGGASDLILNGSRASGVFNAGGTRPTLNDPNLAGNGFIFANNTMVKGLDFVGSSIPFVISGVTRSNIESVNIINAGVGAISMNGGSSNVTLSNININEYNLGVPAFNIGVNLNGVSDITMDNVNISATISAALSSLGIFNSNEVSINNMVINDPTAAFGFFMNTVNDMSLNDFAISNNNTTGLIMVGVNDSVTGSMIITNVPTTCSGGASLINSSLLVNGTVCP